MVLFSDIQTCRLGWFGSSVRTFCTSALWALRLLKSDLPLEQIQNRSCDAEMKQGEPVQKEDAKYKKPLASLGP